MPPCRWLSVRCNCGTAEKQKQPPQRIIFICNSLGFYEPYFFPETRGDLGTSRYLKGLRAIEKMTVFQNLFHPGMDTSNHDSEKSFLTGAPEPEAPNFINTISLDQVLARQMGGDTRFPFLSFSIYDRGWGCSWNDRGVAHPADARRDSNLRQALRRGGPGCQAPSDHQRSAMSSPVFTAICERCKRTGANTEKLPTTPVIRELEAQLKHEEFWLKAKKPVVPNTLSDDTEFAFSTKVHNLLELAKLAFQTDSTRVITFSMDWIYGAIKVPGATGGWHTLSHHANKAETIAQLSRIEADIVRHLDQFLVRTRSNPRRQRQSARLHHRGHRQQLRRRLQPHPQQPSNDRRRRRIPPPATPHPRWPNATLQSLSGIAPAPQHRRRKLWQ